MALRRAPSALREPTTYSPDGIDHSTRRRSRSYSSRASSVSGTDGGYGPIGPEPPGAALDGPYRPPTGRRGAHRSAGAVPVRSPPEVIA